MSSSTPTTPGSRTISPDAPQLRWRGVSLPFGSGTGRVPHPLPLLAKGGVSFAPANDRVRSHPHRSLVPHSPIPNSCKPATRSRSRACRPGPVPRPPIERFLEDMVTERLAEKGLRRGLEDIAAGRTYPAHEVFAHFASGMAYRMSLAREAVADLEHMYQYIQAEQPRLPQPGTAGSKVQSSACGSFPNAAHHSGAPNPPPSPLRQQAPHLSHCFHNQRVRVHRPHRPDSTRCPQANRLITAGRQRHLWFRSLFKLAN